MKRLTRFSMSSLRVESTFIVVVLLVCLFGFDALIVLFRGRPASRSEPKAAILLAAVRSFQRWSIGTPCILPGGGGQKVSATPNYF
jgi:hypothetical protein